MSYRQQSMALSAAGANKCRAQVLIPRFWWHCPLLTQTNGQHCSESVIGPQNWKSQPSIMNELAPYCNAKDDSPTPRHLCWETAIAKGRRSTNLPRSSAFLERRFPNGLRRKGSQCADSRQEANSMRDSHGRKR